MKKEGIRAGVRGEDSSMVQVDEDVIFHAGPTSCSDCGGLFVSDKLHPVTVFQVFSPSRPIVVNETFFCKKCLPVTNIEVNLNGGSGGEDNLDTVYFSTNEGYLQPFDFQGEEQYYVPAEDYSRATCDDCGEFSSVTKCRKCSRKQ
jgi:hypothetical protein